MNYTLTIGRGVGVRLVCEEVERLSEPLISFEDILAVDRAGKTVYIFVRDINRPLYTYTLASVKIATETESAINENIKKAS